MVVAGANRHDMKLVKQTVNSLVVKRPRPTKKHPQGMCLDKGYDYEEVRETLREFGFTAPSGRGAKRHRRANAKPESKRDAGW